MLDKRITYIVCLLRELTASQLVAIATRSDTGSHNRLDLIQSFYENFELFETFVNILSF
jgi:hypothetical protein